MFKKITAIALLVFSVGTLAENKVVPYNKDSGSAKERAAQYKKIAEALTPEDRANWKRIGKKYEALIIERTRGKNRAEALTIRDQLRAEQFKELVQNISPQAVLAIFETRKVKPGHKTLTESEKESGLVTQ